MRRFELEVVPVPASRRLVSLLCAAALLLCNWVAAHSPIDYSMPLIIKDDLMPLRDGHEQLRDELLPIVHECHQVTVTIRAQDMAEDQLTRACILLKETKDHFHTLMQTDPGSPLRGEELEILAFSDPTDINEYWTAVYGGGGGGDFFATYLFRRFAWDTAVVILGGADWGAWAHEYAHHLDWTFNQAIHCLYPHGGEGYLNLGPIEGLAEYVL